MSKTPIIALAATFGLMLLSDSAAAQNEPPERSRELVRLRVPVKMHNMLADNVRVRCWIRTADGRTVLSAHNGTYTPWYDIVGGELDRVIQVDMRPRTDTSFANAKTYDCLLEIPGGTLGFQNPRTGTPSGYPNNKSDWAVAKADQFFRGNTSGPLKPRRWPGGNDTGQQSDSGDLTIGPKERQ